jgi:hypothetical protein
MPTFKSLTPLFSPASNTSGITRDKETSFVRAQNDRIGFEIGLPFKQPERIDAPS